MHNPTDGSPVVFRPAWVVEHNARFLFRPRHLCVASTKDLPTHYSRRV